MTPALQPTYPTTAAWAMAATQAAEAYRVSASAYRAAAPVEANRAASSADRASAEAAARAAAWTAVEMKTQRAARAATRRVARAAADRAEVADRVAASWAVHHKLVKAQFIHMAEVADRAAAAYAALAALLTSLIAADAAPRSLSRAPGVSICVLRCVALLLPACKRAVWTETWLHDLSVQHGRWCRINYVWQQMRTSTHIIWLLRRPGPRRAEP